MLICAIAMVGIGFFVPSDTLESLDRYPEPSVGSLIALGALLLLFLRGRHNH